MPTLLFATRPSALARWQTQWVCRALEDTWPGLICQEMVITTQGDRILDRPLPEIGGKGLFTLELERELLEGRVQAAVHSLKDLPVTDSHGLALGAIPERADVRDVLISASGKRLAELPPAARLGTSSLRRAAQALAFRPDLEIQSLRGNVDTRVRKALAGEYDAIILAGAGVTRLGMQDRITEWLPLEIMLPAPGQGALAVQCRAGDSETLGWLAAVEHTPTRQAVAAERAFLAGLGGGCMLPVGAYAQMEDGMLDLQVVVAAADGRQLIRHHARGVDPLSMGNECAQAVLALGAGDFLPAAE